MSSGFWGGFGAGFAKTFDPVVVGKGLGEAVADYKEGKAVEAAEDKKKQAIAALDKERFQSGATTQQAIGNLDLKNAPQVDLSAVPNPSSAQNGPVTQGQAIDPSHVITPEMTQGQPMADTTYDKRLQAINDSYDNDVVKARADYYRFRGMNKEQEEAEKKLENMKFAQQFGMLHKSALDGDRDAMGQLVGYMNASMGNGMEIQMGEGGKMSLLQNGQVLQKDFVPTRAQIDQAAVSMYNTAKFLRGGGDFDKYLQNMASIKGLDMTDKKFALETAKFDEQRRATGVAENQGQQKINNDMFNAGADRALKQFGIETTASTADKDRTSREAIARAQIQSNESINAENNKTKVLTTGMNNATSVKTTEMNNDARKALQKDAQVFQAGEAEKGREFTKGQQAAKFEHEKGMQTADHRFKAEEAEKGRTFSADQKGLDRAHEAKLAKDRNDVTRRGQILSHVDNQSKLELERDKFKYQKEKDAEAAEAAAKEFARKNGLQYVQDENTGEHVLYDMGSGTPYGAWDRSVGTLIIDGYSKSSVKRMSHQAEALGAKLSYEYVPDRMTGRMRPKYVYVVDGKLCDTIDEVKQVKGITR